MAAVVVGVIALSGDSGTDPRTPPALPGLPPPFLGTAVIGSGGTTAAVDAYGNVVDLRVPGPAGRALIQIPPERQAAGTVPPDSGRVAGMSVGERSIPLWRAASVAQRYLPGTNVLLTAARIGAARIEIVQAALARVVVCRASPRGADGLPPHCTRVGADRAVQKAVRGDRRWFARARPLGEGAPLWAARMYGRSLLVLRALTDPRSGAVAAGARDGWAYAWPRDASAVAIALASAGYRSEARRIVRFLLGLDLEAAARFGDTGKPVEGRAAQGDAAGWVVAAARAAGVATDIEPVDWRERADYQEKSPGDYLANAIASANGLKTHRIRGKSARRPGGGVNRPKTHVYRGKSAHQRGGGGKIGALFGTPRGLTRAAGDPDSGLDSAAAWAVRPFPQPALFPLVRRTLLRLATESGRFGIIPSEDWPGDDPWTAPTAWTAWSLAALARRTARRGARQEARRERHAALGLIAALRRAATPLGMLPERVDSRTGVPRSTTPLTWSHAFAVLALRALWPGRAGS